MEAIMTRYAGPTNARGARIIAASDNHRTERCYHHEESVEENHRQAALKLLDDKMNSTFQPNGERKQDVLGGFLKNGHYAWVVVKPLGFRLIQEGYSFTDGDTFAAMKG